MYVAFMKLDIICDSGWWYIVVGGSIYGVGYITYCAAYNSDEYNYFKRLTNEHKR